MPELRKMILCTRNNALAVKLQLYTEIKCDCGLAGHGGSIYTTWAVFAGLEYFDKMRESGMLESSVKEPVLKFELTMPECEFYLRLIINLHDTVPKFPDDVSAAAIYDQANYHLNETIKKICVDHIRTARMTEELYHFIKDRDLDIDMSKMVVGPEDVDFRPPFTDTVFWTATFHRLSCDIYTPWTIGFRFMTMEEQKLYFKYFKPSRAILNKAAINDLFIKMKIYHPKHFDVAINYIAFIMNSRTTKPLTMI